MRKSYDAGLIGTYVKRYALDMVLPPEGLQYMHIYEFDKGEALCQPDTKLDHMYFLVSGKIKVYSARGNGKLLLLRFYKPLNIVGDVEFLTDYKVRTNVESLNKSRLLGISFERLKQLCYDDSRFLRFIIRNLSHKLTTVSNATSINLLYPVENRFASYLLSTCLDEHESDYAHEIKTAKLTEIAMLLGTSYRHLNRVVNTLIQRNAIVREKKSIRIIDIEALRELACGNLYE